jgi:hypothetical protein
MSEQMKPCPVCGAPAEESELCFKRTPVARCSNRLCYLHLRDWVPLVHWNRRPAEDRLHSQLNIMILTVSSHGCPDYFYPSFCKGQPCPGKTITAARECWRKLLEGMEVNHD